MPVLAVLPRAAGIGAGNRTRAVGKLSDPAALVILGAGNGHGNGRLAWRRGRTKSRL